MQTGEHTASSDGGSGILNEALCITPCPAGKASHFVLCKGDKIKFIIDLKDGKQHLTANVAAYSKGLALLLKLLPIIPYGILKSAKLGYFAQVSLHQDIARFLPENHRWNILVGTYDCAQKIVLQCYANKTTPRIFVKVGNAGSAAQMEREIRFLQEASTYTSFEVPHMQGYCLKDEQHPFNIQVTREFQGEKVPPVLTPELYAVTRELAGERILKDGVVYEFSHGDFAPWNIRKTNGTYTVFDWEHCGMRPAGYDAAYFIIMTEVALHHCSFAEAFESAQSQLRTLAPELRLDYNLMYEEFAKTTKALTF